MLEAGLHVVEVTLVPGLWAEARGSNGASRRLRGRLVYHGIAHMCYIVYYVTHVL